MKKERTTIETASGKLISSIQKEWGKELGSDEAEQSEVVMNRAHDLLMGAKEETVIELLNGLTVSAFLGEEWVKNHPSVQASIDALEKEIGNKA